MIYVPPLQPQRPQRSLRIRGDENLPPTVQNAKTIHQRNKSSPALSTMLGAGGIKTAAKRTAFGDVSNTVNGPRPSKDDSTIVTKPVLQVTGKAGQMLQERRSAAFLRPAQRPLSVSGLKTLLTSGIGATNAEPTVKTATNELVATGPVANTRKVLTKRNTMIFKDSPVDLTGNVDHQPSSSLPLIPSATSLPQVLPNPVFSLPLLKEEASVLNNNRKDSEPAIQEMGLKEAIEAIIEAPALIKAEDVRAPQPVEILNEEKVDLTSYHESISTIKETEEAVSVQATEIDPLPSTMFDAYDVVITKPAPPVHASLPTVSQYPQQVVPSEPEEYWEDDDEENYDEEGYVTARSYRSKGENTTGGATTVLFPYVNQKVKKEIAAAKQIVEATRTAEEIEDECYDTSMVAEYGDEIFDYMKQLEVYSDLLKTTPANANKTF